MKKQVALDIECYRDFFCAVFRLRDARSYTISRLGENLVGDINIANTLLRKYQIVTFNGNGYDLPVISMFLKGWSNRRLKELSDDIIKNNIPRWQLADRHPGLRIINCDHIDLVGATPLQASLKTYGCRIHVPNLQDLPIHPDASITPEQAEQLIAYCHNDVKTTFAVYDAVAGDITLREDMGRVYGRDFRSMSGPQIAEAVIRDKMMERGCVVSKRTSRVKPFKYRVPAFIQFATPELQALLQTVREAEFAVDKNGYVKLPESLDKAIEFAGAKYKMGIGGLHSQEAKQAVVAKADELLGEFDVASMYPSIILGQELYPAHLGDDFVDVYRGIFNDRIAAKRSGDKITSDSLKLVLNSSYGKFGSRYSFLYSPELLIQTTITGQLALLMLIERLDEIGRVVSANTDGVVVLMEGKYWNVATEITEQWTRDTTYVLEWTPYRALYSESVNSYIAMKDAGGTKRKGLYAGGSIAKGYANQVCIDAVASHLEHGDDIAEYIRGCGNVADFLTMRGVRGGAVWRGQELGKVVRWYVGMNGEPIRYLSNGNKVAGSTGAVPMMRLADEVPGDIDYDWYIERAQKTLTKLGVN